MTRLTRLTVGVFEAVAAALVGDQVKVDLVTMAADSPLSGMASWEPGAGCWRVLATDAVKGRELLWLLMHELGHIHQGDLLKGDLSFHGLDRGILEGTASGRVAAVRRGALVRAGLGADRERRADAFAERMTDQVWPIIVEAGYSQLVSELERG